MLKFEDNCYPEKKLSEPQVPSSHTIYAVLGFLNEYIGRTIAQNGDLVEHFWVNETKKADIFEKYLMCLVDEYCLQTSVRREMSEGHTYFLSAEITELINSFYLKHNLTGTDSNGNPAYTTGQGFFQQNTGRISADVFPSEDREAKLSYLIGVHQRYGEENMFLFANAYHKAQLVYQLLQELGSPSVVLVYADPDRAPSPFRVAFEPTAELIDRFCLRAFNNSTG
ncbi:MAG: hypothetical protein MUD14_10765 [Hydrococcus sp. Prado102]|jgi:hypothetical protein|nr:hypothetical protein [Hydrococcus sp. Prado102]